MKVIATQLGYYDNQRRYPADSGHKGAGQPFVLKDPKHFSKKWMKQVDNEPAEESKSHKHDKHEESKTKKHGHKVI